MHRTRENLSNWPPKGVKRLLTPMALTGKPQLSTRVASWPAAKRSKQKKKHLKHNKHNLKHLLKLLVSQLVQSCSSLAFPTEVPHRMHWSLGRNQLYTIIIMMMMMMVVNKCWGPIQRELLRRWARPFGMQRRCFSQKAVGRNYQPLGTLTKASQSNKKVSRWSESLSMQMRMK